MAIWIIRYFICCKERVAILNFDHSQFLALMFRAVWYMRVKHHLRYYDMCEYHVAGDESDSLRSYIGVSSVSMTVTNKNVLCVPLLSRVSR